jgi:hypothetical protein
VLVWVAALPHRSAPDPTSLRLWRGGLVGEERVQMGMDRRARFDGKAGHQRIHRGIG